MPVFLVEENLDVEGLPVGRAISGVVVAESLEKVAEKFELSRSEVVEGKIRIGPFIISEVRELERLPKFTLIPAENADDGFRPRSPTAHAHQSSGQAVRTSKLLDRLGLEH